MSWSDVLSVSEVRDAMGLPPLERPEGSGIAERGSTLVVALGDLGRSALEGVDLPGATIVGVDTDAGESLARAMAGAGVVVVVADLGGRAAAMSVARMAKGAGAVAFGVFAGPGPSEMRQQWERAQLDLAEVSEVFDSVVTVPVAVDRYPTRTAAFVDARYRLAMASVSIVSSVASWSDARVERSELRERLHGPGAVAVGVGRGGDAREAVSAALADLKRLNGSVDAARGVLLHIGAPRVPRLLELAKLESLLTVLLPVDMGRVTWSTDERVGQVYATALVSGVLPRMDPDGEPCMASVGLPREPA